LDPPSPPLRLQQLLDAARRQVQELMPWELQARLAESEPPLLVDVREPAEFARVRLAGSLNVPRGVLEQACEWEFEETEPLLAATRTRALVLVCRSGNRSLLAAEQLVRMGFTQVRSLRTGLRGWVDAELPGLLTPMAQYVFTMNRVGKIVPPKRQILKDISLSFFPGAKIGVLGVNGSGKSTLLKIMAGRGQGHRGRSRPDAGMKIGYLPQEPELEPEQTVREAVEKASAACWLPRSAWTRCTPSTPSRTPTSTSWPPSRRAGSHHRRCRQREHRPAAGTGRRRAAPAPWDAVDRQPVGR
jgi:rhodanese-related sulfurtransferase